MPKTNLQRKASYYERFIKEYKENELSKKYESFYVSLEKLVDISKKLNSPDVQMTAQNFIELKLSYKSVLKDCSKYLKTDDKQFNSFEKSQRGIVKDIARVLYKDMKVLEECNPMEPGTLSEVIAKSRSHKVVLKDDGKIRVGGALSNRIPLKTNNDKKGFFTPKSIYNNDKEWKEQIDKYIPIFDQLNKSNKFPKVNLDNLEKLKSDENFMNTFCKWCPGCTINEFIEMTNSRPEGQRRIAIIGFLLGIGNDHKKAHEILNNNYDNLGLKEQVRNFMNDMSRLVNQRDFMKIAGIKKNSNISDRNCAMSEIANLLGCGNVLAKSVPMTIEINDEKVDGVFMETVEGTDVNRIKEDDIVFEATEESFSQSKALNQLVDLQVLDYVCGNVDRHGGNIIYQFGKGNDGKVYLNGIKGIDNDCSMGTLTVKDGEQFSELVTPDKMQFIRNDMYEKLKLLNETTIYNHLAPYALSEDEKNAVLTRVANVMEAIKEGKIYVIKEENFWEKNPLKSQVKYEKNYIGRMQNIAETCKAWFKGKNGIEDEEVDKEIHYLSDRRMGNQIMYNNLDAIQKLKEEMNNSKSVFFDSSEYKMMKKRFEKIETLTYAIRNDFTSPDKIPEDRADELEKAYIDLADKTNRYIELKKIIPSTENGKKRTEFARNLLNFASTTLNGRELNPEKEHNLEDIDPAEIKEDEIDAMCM